MASLALLALASPVPEAPAATQLGQTFAPSTNCIDHVTLVQGFAQNNAYTVPFPGVITSWSNQAPAVPGQVKFKVYRRVDPTHFTAIGESAFESPAANVVSTFPTRITVASGDLLGMSTGATSHSCTRPASNHEISFSSADPAPGTTIFMMASPSDSQLDIAAVLEPDADGDGYGDETQDCDPTSASKATDCTAPETTITTGPRNRTRRKRARFEFSGEDARAVAGFECSVDGGAFASCASPYAVRVKKGRHTFSVRATDGAGNADGSPATDDWRVKKKKKKN